eukprot:scaffold416_cov329-Pavlova_lutheri.AAC.9
MGLLSILESTSISGSPPQNTSVSLTRRLQYLGSVSSASMASSASGNCARRSWVLHMASATASLIWSASTSSLCGASAIPRSAASPMAMARNRHFPSPRTRTTCSFSTGASGLALVRTTTTRLGLDGFPSVPVGSLVAGFSSSFSPFPSSFGSFGLASPWILAKGDRFRFQDRRSTSISLPLDPACASVPSIRTRSVVVVDEDEEEGWGFVPPPDPPVSLSGFEREARDVRKGGWKGNGKGRPRERGGDRIPSGSQRSKARTVSDPPHTHAPSVRSVQGKGDRGMG